MPQEFTHGRVSVGNLARYFIGRPSGPSLRIAVLNPKLYNRDRTRLWQAFGGGAELTDEGRAFIKSLGGELEGEEGDARFTVPYARFEQAVAEFASNIGVLCEFSVTRELCEELTREELQMIPPILTEEEACAVVNSAYRQTVLQPLSLPASDTSPNARSFPTQRVFYLHDVYLPDALLDRIVASDATRVLPSAEVATTGGGAHRGETSDGGTLANNIWDY